MLIASVLPAPALHAQDAPASAVERVRQQAVAFVQRMADLTCTEQVVQEKLRPDGRTESAERSQFDDLIMVRASPQNLSLNESRIEAAAAAHKPLPLLVTNGFSMLLLVFHPYYEGSFRFTPGEPQVVQGKTLLPVRFAHIAGTRSPAALELRGREYPLDLEGTAWTDQTGGVETIEARLGQNMSDLGLRTLTIRVEYGTSTLPGARGMALPVRAVIELETKRQHWRNTHRFSGYKSFSTAAEQSSTVRVVSVNSARESNATTGSQNARPRPQH